jgi:hypothetical protein
VSSLVGSGSDASAFDGCCRNDVTFQRTRTWKEFQAVHLEGHQQQIIEGVSRGRAVLHQVKRR